MIKASDAIVIGAGVAGLYQLYRLREMGLSVRAFEAGGDVGGTWYWNRYPGARFDSESYSYGYSFSPELLKEWEWSEHFAAQPETLRYLTFVADKFDLRRDITFNARVTAATYDAKENLWRVHLENGETAAARFLITALGALSAPQMPVIDGIETFEGPWFHTARWPHEPVDFAGKRVAVIGTGATGVQVIQEVAKTAAQLIVFQRSPNWCAPLHNSPITDDEQRRIKATYSDIFARCSETFGGFIHTADRRLALEVSEEEREATYERLYAEPGFGIWMANFRDVLVNEAANATLSDFIARKIRERVNDPAVADLLIPTDHGFGTRRVPLETRYHEVYNQENVRLVDLRTSPIKCVTPGGIRTVAAEFDVDIIIYATGFDPVTGAYDCIDIRGDHGQSLAEKWADGPLTYLGIQFGGFPNLFALVGPHSASTFCNMPRCIEQSVDWVTALIRHLREKGLTRVSPTEDAEREWTAHVHEVSTMFLMSRVNSWFTGINSNKPGKQERRILVYPGGAPAYRERLDEIAVNGYQGFVLQ